MLLRGALIGILCATLIQAPVWSAPAAPLGVVDQAINTQLGSGLISPGATLYSGDRLVTGEGGAASIRAGRAQFRFQADSSAVLKQSSTGLDASLERGTVLFSIAPNDPVRVLADDTIVMPVGGGPATGKIQLISANVFDVYCLHGALELVVDGETHVIGENHGYRVTIVADPEPGGSPVVTPRKRHAVLVALLVFGLGAGAGVLVYKLFFVSGSAL